jgi:predicted RNase H-like nuclease
MLNGYLGVDGCRSGWFIIQLSQSGSWNTALAQNRNELAKHIESSILTLIDIPIGLLESGGPQRECDQQARKALGMPRAASVFSVPSRPAVYANGYTQACQLNYQLLGKKLGKQTWNISDKIRQVDELLQNNLVLRGKLRESHPEVCFWALNNKNAMRFNKKQIRGREERMHVLTCYFPKAHQILEIAADNYSRKQVAIDDIIDAMVLAITAVLGYKTLSSFPNVSRLDDRSLRMEIAFWTPYGNNL